MCSINILRTYAPTITTVQKREYVLKESREGTERTYKEILLENDKIVKISKSEITRAEKNKLFPTNMAMIVNDFLVKNFAAILDYNFTAKVEQDFDEIAEGNINWAKMMQEFYAKFHPNVLEVGENAERESGERILGKDPKTGKQVLVRLGKFGPVAQIGEADDEEKQFASLRQEQNIGSITLEEALNLFLLPKNLGIYKGEEIEVSNGRFGPYVKFGDKFISLPKGLDPMRVEIEDAIELVKEKEAADAPIYEYDGLPVQKGKGRFGPFIKWNNMFINVNKKYDWDHLSNDDIESLIKDKIQKEIDKLIHDWEEDGIRVEKARWGRHNIIQGKTKIELPKTVDATKLTLEEVKGIIAKNAPKKKTRAKKKK